MKQKFFGVNNTHTFQYNKENGIFYVGMEVQGLDKKKPREFVMMFHEEDIEDLLEYFSMCKLTSNE